MRTSEQKPHVINTLLERDLEKWRPVFRTDHAPPKVRAL